VNFEHLALAAVRDVLGELVTIDPDGVAVQVKAIARKPDAEEGVYSMRVRVPTVTLEFVTADLSALGIEIAENDVIEMANGERRVVKNEPSFLDTQRLVTTVDTLAE